VFSHRCDPQAVRGLKREVRQVACGNNCTVMLVERFRMPKLQELCIETVAQNYSLYEHVGAYYGDHFNTIMMI
jgi:hypothetical protein